MTPRLLSIALPVRNGSQYLAEALDSVLSQSHRDFELVVSDNQSVDETPAVLAKFAADDSRIRVSRTDSLLEPAQNFNRVTRLCEGEWIKFLCHDDLLRPDCLSRIVAAIGEPGSASVGVVANGEEWMFGNGVVHRGGSGRTAAAGPSKRAGRQTVRDNLAGRGGAGLPSLTTATIRKAAWEGVGGFDERYIHFDIFCWIKLLQRWDLLEVPSALTLNRIHGAQVAVSARKSLRSVRDFERFFSEFLAEHGDALNFSFAERARVRLKPHAVAATAVAIELMKHQPARAAELVSALPVTWWPLMLPLVVRSWRRESLRVRELRHRVPLELIYP